jgi:outer membrane protein TolC
MSTRYGLDLMQLSRNENRMRDPLRHWAALCLLAAPGLICPLGAQTATPSTSTPTAPAPDRITLQEAIHRAQASEPNFAMARADAKVAGLDRSIARAALLPNAIYHNQYLYTQGAGATATLTSSGSTTPSVVFIANNAVHEYVSQLSITETLGLKSIADVRLTNAAAAQAAAAYEISRRGLVQAVVGLYYTLAADEHKVQVAERAAAEAAGFTDLTQKREAARESAHADVVKAQLQQLQRERDLADAHLAADKSRLELGVLLYPDPRTPYAVETGPLSPLPARADVEAQAARRNPDLQSALAALRVSNASVLGAQAAYLPDLILNYSYGIDAAQFAANGPAGINNLGYSASATLDIPVWDWLATPHRVKQQQIRREVSRIALSATQRHLIAALNEAYAEAAEAQRQAASLDLSAQTAAESLRLTKMRYTAGEATVLEVVDAQAALATAENAREDGLVRYETALANLQTLTGTL